MAIPPFKVKALYDYASAEEDDLKFKSNQIITVTEEEDADWFYGEYEDEAGSKHEGLFPKNFIKIIEPEAPPRPVRSSRPRKDHETINESRGSAKVDIDQVALSTHDDSATNVPSQTLAETLSSTNEPSKAAASTTQSGEAVEDLPSVSASAKRSNSGAAKPPPPVSEKPASNAFRDRINAFNKPAAAPVAPVKPGNLGNASGSGFVKKPFVAPPPSKNAYVPPPREVAQAKVYRREEDPELSPPVKSLDNGNSNLAEPVAVMADDEEDLPKPTSLKDRIALLQRQQMEQAARHAEAIPKKEKPKRPGKAQASDQIPSDTEDQEGAQIERNFAANENPQDAPGLRRRKSSKEAQVLSAEDPTFAKDLLSDGNDADQSGAGDTEEGEESHTGHGDSLHRSSGKLGRDEEEGALPLEDPASPMDQPSREDEEEDEIDPEVKRRMEIRNRMAKMSGGMGMAGMFVPTGGSSSKKPAKQSDRKGSGRVSLPDEDEPRAAPVPILPMSGLQKVRSPDGDELLAGPSDQAPVLDGEIIPKSEVQNASFNTLRRSTDQQPGQPKPQDRPVPPPPAQAPVASPILSATQQPLSPPPPSRPVPPPPRQLASPSEGSESDDELSSHERRPIGDNVQPSSRQGPFPAPQVDTTNARYSSEETNRSAIGIAPASESRRGHDAQSAEGPLSPPAQYAPSSRAPPPPPSAPAPRDSTSSDRPRKTGRHGEARNESDEEITEYEGDYDTDIASGAGHKDALKAHVRTPSLEDDSIADEFSLHHSGLPSIGPPVVNPPRMVPPPPPATSQPQRKRQSSDMPRAAPPPPPPPKQKMLEEDEEYDPYSYNSPVHGIINPEIDERLAARTPTAAVVESEDSSPSPTVQHRRLPSIEKGRIESSGSSALPIPGNSDPRRSTDIQRLSTTIRRSTDMSRPSGEHHMAADIDLYQDRGWWARPSQPPSVIQNRRDVIYEVDESSASRRGGKTVITKDVYILYMDYSQTVISVQFESTEPENVAKLEQKHEPPPRIPRQDQLEEAHQQLGVRVAEFAKTKEGAIVGDGTSQALPLELISMVTGALPAVGNRSFGALVYANLANATVQQHDEIRSGDIITFRNTKFGGHRGPMKSKYSHDIGKPDHVGVVVDWDGTKKKVRAWEQGRESKKVKIESFKFGDLKSGEIRVWRLMSRAWVGWDGNN